MKALTFLFALLLSGTALAGDAYSERHDDFSGSTIYYKNINSSFSFLTNYGHKGLGLVAMKMVPGPAASDAVKDAAKLGLEFAVQISSKDPLRIDEARPLYMKLDDKDIIEVAPVIDSHQSNYNSFATQFSTRLVYVATIEQCDKIVAATKIQFRVYHDEGEETDTLTAPQIKKIATFYVAMKDKGLIE